MTATGNLIMATDIPPEFGGAGNTGNIRETPDWTHVLANWAACPLPAGTTPLLASALPEFANTLIRIAMRRTDGHRQEARELLG